MSTSEELISARSLLQYHCRRYWHSVYWYFFIHFWVKFVRMAVLYLIFKNFIHLLLIPKHIPLTS